MYVINYVIYIYKYIYMNNLVEFYIICYNNLFCVEFQIKTINAFFKDPYKIIIIDSNCGEHIENSIKKKEICDKYQIEMITLPNELSGKNLWSSIILGNKLNYVYHNIIKIRKPKYFSFLDQDFFLFKPFSVIEKLDKYGMYGDVQMSNKWDHKMETRKNFDWVLHPWLSFFKLDFIINEDMNWLPIENFDTGGGNSSIIKKKNLDIDNYWIRDLNKGVFPWKDVSNSGPSPYENQYFQYKDKKIYGLIQIYNKTFIHMLNSHMLDDPFNPKTAWCLGFLEHALNYS